ncbi:DUF3987 domain-containing protein [Blastopirellula marina]|uniref:DNA primase/polymerase bifunctional N-terminal domain-containing protein n=1 Tax=Blastopirellula marina TaxID=124 RepID=A0A2S8GQL0_9BACT|nr:DUF3987 domain-containing protein [Blastopirellula marina]PQO46718.1 hypothetical protein C5Y93_07745 [Blastopirellula marina]
MTQTAAQLETSIKSDNIPAELVAAKQWVLWRYETRNDKPTKVPYSVTGAKASTVDPMTWATFGEVLADVDEPQAGWNGVGFVFTPEDDFIGIDLDDCLDDEGQPFPWAAEIIEGFATYTEISPSGKGVKLFFKGEFPLDRGRKVQREEGGAIEVYTKGRYFTVTGERFGDVSEVATASTERLAAWADHYFTPAAKPVVALPMSTTTAPAVDVVDRARRYASAYPPAVSGQGGHDTTFRLACVLVNGFELGTEPARTILEEWNLSCQPPWTERELTHKIRQAEKEGAKGDRGYMLQNDGFTSHALASGVDLSSFKGCQSGIDSGCPSEISSQPISMPEVCLDAPGLIGDVLRYMLRSALYPLPEVSLAAAIGLMSVLACRKVKTFKGATPNVYMIGVAPSGSGKDHPRKVVRSILNAADGGSLVGPENFKSGSAIVESLTVQPAFVSQIDEIRDLFRAMAGNNASPWLQDIATVLLTVWGSGLAAPWKASARADAKFNREVFCPQPVIFGTTTELIWQSITSDMKDGGLLGRFCTLQTCDAAKMQSDPFDDSTDDLPPEIVERVRNWIEFRPGGNLTEQFPKPFNLPLTDDAKQAFRNHWASIQAECDGADEATRGLLTRSQEITTRLALVAACACHDPADGLNGFEIDASHVQWAEALVNWSNQIKLYQVSRHLAESSHHKNVLKVKRIIQDAGKGGLSASDLTRKTQWINSQTRRDVLQTVLDSGEVVAKEIDTTGRKKTVFCSAGS